MKILHLIAATTALACLWTTAASAQAVEKLYVLDCGQGEAKDQSRWSPGVNVGQPIALSDNCYLIRHAQGWLMWDTGIPEAVANMPDGLVGGGGLMVWKRPKTIAAQLAAIGVSASDIKLVAISHTHGDHVGNVDMFPTATVLMQKAEHEWAFSLPNKPFNAEHPTRLLDGDFDVFGDGSVTIIATPGHTPGHQVLLVKLPNTGAVVLSGDAAHFKDNWDNRRVPSMNYNRDLTLNSLQRIADTLEKNKAQFWINHDRAQSDAYKRPPAFYD